MYNFHVNGVQMNTGLSMSKSILIRQVKKLSISKFLLPRMALFWSEFRIHCSPGRVVFYNYFIFFTKLIINKGAALIFLTVQCTSMYMYSWVSAQQLQPGRAAAYLLLPDSESDETDTLDGLPPEQAQLLGGGVLDDVLQARHEPVWWRR